MQPHCSPKRACRAELPRTTGEPAQSCGGRSQRLQRAAHYYAELAARLNELLVLAPKAPAPEQEARLAALISELPGRLGDLVFLAEDAAPEREPHIEQAIAECASAGELGSYIAAALRAALNRIDQLRNANARA